MVNFVINLRKQISVLSYFISIIPVVFSLIMVANAGLNDDEAAQDEAKKIGDRKDKAYVVEA